MAIQKLRKFFNKMGVIISHKDLYSFVKKRGVSTIAVDVPLFAHKYQYSYGNIFIGFLNLYRRFKTLGVKLIFVFEGRSPPEKAHTNSIREKRKRKMREKLNNLLDQLCTISDVNNANKANKKEIMRIQAECERLNRNIIHISRDQYEKLKEMFTCLNADHIDAQGEADGMCVKLFKEKIVDACLSDDMDLLVGGCDILIKFEEGKVIEYNLKHILKHLNLTYPQFVELCMLFGCDYCTKPFPELDQDDLFTLVNNYQTYEVIVNNVTEITDPIKFKNFLNSYKNGRNLYLKSGDTEIVPSTVKNIKDIKEKKVKKTMNVPNVIHFMKKNILHLNNYIISKIGDSLTKLNKTRI